MNTKQNILNALKMFYANLKEVFVKKSDVVDDTKSTSPSLPLSANQGRVLKNENTDLKNKYNDLTNKYNELNSSFNFKNVQGQIGKNDSINCFANIYMKTFPGRKCDIHIQFRIDMQNPTTENWPVFDMAALCGLLQIKSLSFPYGIIRPIGHEIPQLEDVRCGFQLAESGQVGRYYKYESTGQEGWGAYSVKSLFENKFLVLNHYYEIDIYGATYS